MIGVLPNLHAQCTFGVCLALKFLLKGAGQVPDTLGWSPDILCACHPSPVSKTHHPSLEIFEAGLHDPIRDIYKGRVQPTFRFVKILTHKQT